MLLRLFRIGLSTLFFLAITAYFLDFAGYLPEGMNRLMKIQFVPALVGHWEITVGLLLMVLVLGRFYCSSICPLGVLQDVIAWCGRRLSGKKRFAFRPSRTWLRWGIFTVFFLALAKQLNIVTGPLDPYAAYGRIVTHLLRPIYQTGNNLLAWGGAQSGKYWFYFVDISFFLVPFLVALGTLILVGVLAYRRGRTYCNTICPVGTLLGLFSRLSLFKIRIDAQKCGSCGLCEARCKGMCIEAKQKKVDHTRCVVCMDCLTACRKDAIHYTLPTLFSRSKSVPDTITEATEEKTLDAPVPTADRREFLGLLAATAVTAISAPGEAAEKLEEVQTGQIPSFRTQPIAPAGSLGVFHLKRHCTACHLCITKCPANILKPAFLEYGLGGIMVPTLDFTHGFCNFECTLCGEVCPNSAITLLTPEEKTHTQVGRVHFVEDNCVVKKNGTNCGACSEHCPTQAVQMVPYRGALTIPKIDADLCVGCGACEHICPTRPYRAIYVEGLSKHARRKEIEEAPPQNVELDDFGF